MIKESVKTAAELVADEIVTVLTLRGMVPPTCDLNRLARCVASLFVAGASNDKMPLWARSYVSNSIRNGKQVAAAAYRYGERIGPNIPKCKDITWWVYAQI